MTNKLTIPNSKKSGIFTKNYKDYKQRNKAENERMTIWEERHGRKKALKIMLQQGIISEQEFKEKIL